ncbi:MAG TPA: DEAD/DEAH box helicase, partial [Bacteroidia bacterium]|nr:DEAD/DEAH box helicase [Bacteroidia bacterium]
MADYLNAIELAENLRERLEEVALSSIDIRDSELQNKLNEVIKSEDGLISEILVEGAFPAKKHTQTLNNIPFLNKKFLKLLDLNKVFDPNFYPYKHQYETLKIVSDMDENNKPAIVITAPTGSGKTESFLLPMLNDLISNPRKKGETGVRVIILYPMNALVADQNKRLFSYLKGQSKIRMFFYNSETPETEKYATDEFNDKCFVKTRKEARENPPDIMITNYSMLEYILARPNDYPLIGNALRTIIVDEAHIYTGTLAAEVSLLLRRVIAKAKINNSKVLYIATTATISDNKEEQQDFFSKFFNKSKNKIINVRGEKEFKEIDKDINVDN